MKREHGVGIGEAVRLGDEGLCGLYWARDEGHVWQGSDHGPTPPFYASHWPTGMQQWARGGAQAVFLLASLSWTSVLAASMFLLLKMLGVLRISADVEEADGVELKGLLAAEGTLDEDETVGEPSDR